jgi:hypothetical protein
MSSEKNSVTEKETLTQVVETSPKPLKLTESIVLSLKLLMGGAVFMMLLWLLDTHVTT